MIKPTHPRPTARADFSRERRRHVVALLRRSGVLSNVSPDAQLLYTVGALICDANGRFSKAELDAATADPSIIEAARQLLRKAAA